MQVTRQALVQLRSFCPAAESTGVACQRWYHKNVSSITQKLHASPMPESDCAVGRRVCIMAKGEGQFRRVSISVQTSLSSILTDILQVVDHYEKPRNVGSFDKKDLDVGTGLVGAPACGDVMKLQIRVRISLQS